MVAHGEVVPARHPRGRDDLARRRVDRARQPDADAADGHVREPVVAGERAEAADDRGEGPLRPDRDVAREVGQREGRPGEVDGGEPGMVRAEVGDEEDARPAGEAEAAGPPPPREAPAPSSANRPPR